MFDAFDKLAARNASRLRPADVQPVKVTSVRQLQDVLVEFDPSRAVDGPIVTLSTTLIGEDEGGRRQKYAVSAPTQSKSRRTMLLEGFDVIRRQQEFNTRKLSERVPVTVNGRDMLPPTVAAPADAGYFVDPLITRWTGGTRVGLLITWDFGDGYTYKYDIFGHKLIRVQNAQA